jgi:hypothetical protein
MRRVLILVGLSKTDDIQTSKESRFAWADQKHQFQTDDDRKNYKIKT